MRTTDWGLERDLDVRSTAQLQMLHSLAARLNRLGDTSQIGDAITGELGNLIDYHNCRVFLLQPDGTTLLPIAFRGTLSEYQGETFDALVLQVGEGLTGHVAQTGRSYYAPDSNEDPHAIVIPGTPEVDESILAVPLLYGDQVTGVIVLSKLGIDQFDLQDQRVLEVLASHAAIALENSRLLHLERESARMSHESEARKSAILESALDCIVAIDHAGNLIEFNPAAERTFGYSKKAVLGKEMAEAIIPPGLREAHRQGLSHYLDGGESKVLGKRLELTAMRADGTEFPVELAITKVDLPGPSIFTAYIRDITERKRAEADTERALQAEREAVKRLRELDELKNSFLQAVSHDLRTPLAAILGLAVTLAREDLDLPPEDEQDLLSRLAANARKLDRILANLLDLDRLASGLVMPRREATNLKALVLRIIQEADYLGDREITVDADSTLWEVDPSKVERIIENLLVNAARHTAPGTPIWVRVGREGRAVLIVVEDAGPGIPEELRTVIFEPFRQGEQKLPSPGSGIGLALVARFAALHGGRAWVQQREGGGASFRVILPDPEEVT